MLGRGCLCIPNPKIKFSNLKPNLLPYPPDSLFCLVLLSSTIDFLSAQMRQAKSGLWDQKISNFFFVPFDLDRSGEVPSSTPRGPQRLHELLCGVVTSPFLPKFNFFKRLPWTNHKSWKQTEDTIGKGNSFSFIWLNVQTDQTFHSKVMPGQTFTKSTFFTFLDFSNACPETTRARTDNPKTPFERQTLALSSIC